MPEPDAPLAGIRVVDLSQGIAGPYCAMLLAQHGADVIKVEPPDGDWSRTLGARYGDQTAFSVVGNLGKRAIALDLKRDGDREVIMRLAARAHVFIEGFRPGVAERLGIGPQECLERNPAVVYGRMTGWGQEGPYAPMAGHDINYIALAGALDPIGRAGGPPVPPLNLVGDFGGGGMLLAFGVVCALLEASNSGEGQVVDAAMVDGSAVLTTMFHGIRAGGLWSDERGTNMLDSGAHFYDVYETADGKYVSVGSIEPQFYAELLRLTGLDGADVPHMDRARWPELKGRLAEVFRTRTRDEWCEVMEGTDVCFAPVLSLSEAPTHPHNRHRGTFIEVDGVVQPAAAPRFSRTPGGVSAPPAQPGQHTDDVLADFGFQPAEVADLRSTGAVA